MTDGLRARQARPEDAAGVAAVHVASWRAAYRGIVSREILDGLDGNTRAIRFYERHGWIADGGVKTGEGGSADGLRELRHRRRPTPEPA
ncbi:hypothetical protein [Agromyces archimandritae]|uniref:GNAT family N-acetyltransferase n=1 Tax=Agromyces archimandritae TaxID=2781962 RepID=A0A975IMW1_9MICO|nr:hypothetical protein [Agromyces archimandritae]QTX03952.1 hypothetical protein G127AT_11630 [Agromyces archimandritae]